MKSIFNSSFDLSKIFCLDEFNHIFDSARNILFQIIKFEVNGFKIKLQKS